MAYEVQTYTICDGWINTWSIEDENGTRPETFNTQKEAQTALKEFFADLQAEIDAGERAQDEGYDPDDYRIEKISDICPLLS